MGQVPQTHCSGSTVVPSRHLRSGALISSEHNTYTWPRIHMLSVWSFPPSTQGTRRGPAIRPRPGSHAAARAHRRALRGDKEEHKVQSRRGRGLRGSFIGFKKQKTSLARRPRVPAQRRWPAGQRSRWLQWRLAQVILWRTEDHVTPPTPKSSLGLAPACLPSLLSTSLPFSCSAHALPPSWSTLAGGVLSSGAGAEVGNGGPETANSCLWLVLSRGPSPEDNSIGSFHKVGLGSWGPSAAKSKIDSGTQVVWAGMPTLPNRSTKGCPTPHSTRPGIGLGNSLSL